MLKALSKYPNFNSHNLKALSPTRKMSTIPLSSIPTLAELYSSGTLSPSSTSTTSFSPSSTLNSRVSLIRASITTLGVTSIVNAANETLLGGGGVDGVIHRAAGPGLLKECRTLGGCKTGNAKITGGYELPAKNVIHAVGPIYYVEKGKREGRQEELLRGCYRNCLDLAEDIKLGKGEKGTSIAFNCISTGIYGYPSGEAAEVACTEVRRWLSEEGKDGDVERVVFCVFEMKDVDAYQEWLPKIFPPAPTTDSSTSTSQPPTQEATAQAADDDVEASGVIVPQSPEEPAAKKAKTESSAMEGKEDWEAVEKPADASFEAKEKEKEAELREEGEKIEQPNLAESDGEEVERPPKEELSKSAAGFDIVEEGK